MKEITTKTVEINKPVEIVFNTLSSFTSFSTIPNDKVKDFKSTQDTCSFTVSDMAEVELKITDRQPYSSITIISNKEIMGGFAFSIILMFDKKDDNNTFLHSVCSIKGNPMMLMMMKKQIENGLNMLMDGIKENLNK
jgi:hypothetical protein